MSRWDRSPDLVETQVTYPIVTAMLGAPHVKTVRGVSDFGYSYVYVIFDDNTDLYWARSRTLRISLQRAGKLPEGVKTELGPDATSLGWVFQYALIDESGKHSLSEMRSYEDWYLRYHLRSVPGVADVAPIGGYTRQYQVNLDPKLPPGTTASPSARSSMRSGKGTTKPAPACSTSAAPNTWCAAAAMPPQLSDFQNIVVASPEAGAPVRVKDLGEVVTGPDLRRGVGRPERRRRSGLRHRHHAQRRERARRHRSGQGHAQGDSSPACPPASRSFPSTIAPQLIHHTIDNAQETILEVVVTVVLIILVFLWHFPSASIPLHHHAGRGAVVVHPAAHDGHQRQRHVASPASPSLSAN